MHSHTYGNGRFCKRKYRLPPAFGQLVELLASVAGRSVHAPAPTVVLVCRVTQGRPNQVIGMLPPEGGFATRLPKLGSCRVARKFVPNSAVMLVVEPSVRTYLTWS